MSTLFNEEDCLAYNPFEGDFGEPGDRTLSDKISTSRKEHKCNECLETIQKGERYRNIKSVINGDILAYKFCYKCCEAFAAAFDYEDEEKFERLLDERSQVRDNNMGKRCDQAN